LAQQRALSTWRTINGSAPAAHRALVDQAALAMPATSRQVWTARLRAARSNSSKTVVTMLKEVMDLTVWGSSEGGEAA
jgi:hypothetical protein